MKRIPEHVLARVRARERVNFVAQITHLGVAGSATGFFCMRESCSQGKVTLDSDILEIVLFCFRFCSFLFSI